MSDLLIPSSMPETPLITRTVTRMGLRLRVRRGTSQARIDRKRAAIERWFHRSADQPDRAIGPIRVSLSLDGWELQDCVFAVADVINDVPDADVRAAFVGLLSQKRSYRELHAYDYSNAPPLMVRF